MSSGSAALPAEAERLLETAVTKLGFSARAYDRVLKVARTIADLEASEGIGTAPRLRGRPVPDDGQTQVTFPFQDGLT